MDARESPVATPSVVRQAPAAAPPTAVPARGAAAVQALQRTAGNRATAAALRSIGAPSRTLARCGAGGCTCGGGCGSGGPETEHTVDDLRRALGG